MNLGWELGCGLPGKLCEKQQSPHCWGATPTILILPKQLRTRYSTKSPATTPDDTTRNARCEPTDTEIPNENVVQDGRRKEAHSDCQEADKEIQPVQMASPSSKYDAIYYYTSKLLLQKLQMLTRGCAYTATRATVTSVSMQHGGSPRVSTTV